jgi:hypothetical protein
VVVDHPVDVGGDPPLVPAVEPLERAVVPRPRGGDERLIGEVGTCPSQGDRCGYCGYGPLLLVQRRPLLRAASGDASRTVAFI